jgi:hypothetical protein
MSKAVKISPNQRRMFEIDDVGNVTYLVGPARELDFTEVLQDPDFEQYTPFEESSEYEILTFQEEVENKRNCREKEDNRTVQLAISDLEKIRRILVSIPQFADLALATNQDIDSIEFLAWAVEQVDFVSLPHFDLDMSIFDILPKNNPERRAYIFNEIITIVNSVSVTGKLPKKAFLKRIFIDFGENELETIYLLVKRILKMLEAWGGIQIHLFEQLVRDWLYIVYEKGCNLTKEEIYLYLRDKYTCKPDYEIELLASILYNSVSFNPTLDEFVDELLMHLSSYTPEGNIFLQTHEVELLWSSEFIKNRIYNAADKWKERIRSARIASEDVLDGHFGVVNRLSARVRERALPTEMGTSNSINETAIKMKLYFPEGHRTLIEARIDRLVRLNGSISIYDWKTTGKRVSEMNDFEKLQIILQSMAVQSSIGRVKEGKDYSPMQNNDYRFFLTSNYTQWTNFESLPWFYFIPEKTEGDFDYIYLNIDPLEAQRIVTAFSKIVFFLICNKKVIAGIRKHLKTLDSFISPPSLSKVNLVEA